jgi:hypothetical protein
MTAMPMITVLRRLAVLAVPATRMNAVICTWSIMARVGGRLLE